MNSTTVEQLLTDGFTLHQNGDLRSAEQLYRSSLTIDPENLNALQLLGLLYHQSGKQADAVELLQHAVKTLEEKENRPAQYAAIYNNFGNALRAIGRGKDAVVQYRHGLALDPELYDIHANLGDELCIQGNLCEAIASYEEARRRGSLAGRRLCCLGSAYGLLKRYPEAEAAYRDAITPYFKSAMSSTSGQKKITSFSNPMLCFRPGVAASRHPEGQPTLQTAATPVSNKSSAAIEPYRELVTAIPLNPDLYYLFGWALRSVGDTRAAIEIFEAGIALNPNHIPNNYELAVSLTKMGFAPLAIPFLEKAIELKPNFASFYVELGNALHFAGQSERALDCYRRAFHLEPVRTWKAKKSPAEFSALAIEGLGVGNTPAQFLLSEGSFECNFFALMAESIPDDEMLRRSGDVVISLISDADQGRHMLPIAAELIDRLGKPVINHPRKIMATDRVITAERLKGIRLCRVPKTIRCQYETLTSSGGPTALVENGFTFPLLICVAGRHGGEAFEKLHNPDEVAIFLKQNPDREYYVSEYADYQSLDGYYRKYRFIFVNSEIFPYHLAICDDWKVHHFRTDMAAHAWMQEEENAFLENPWNIFSAAHRSAFIEIQAAFDLDFFGIDCSLDRNGQIVIFEVNASMLIHDDNVALPYKTPHCVRNQKCLSRDAGVRR